MQAFEDEMEWRYLAEVTELPFVESYCTAGFVEEERHHRMSRGHCLAVPQEYIEAVFVLALEELSLLENEFPSLTGKIRVRA